MTEQNQQFEHFPTWVNMASSWLTRRGPHVHAVCIDAKGRACLMGKDFMRARDEDAFPVRWLWPEDVVALAADRDRLAKERDEAAAIIRNTLWMAQRYAHGHRSYAVGMYNDAARRAFEHKFVEPNRDHTGWALDGTGRAEYASLDKEENAEALKNFNALAVADAELSAAIARAEKAEAERDEGQGAAQGRLEGQREVIASLTEHLRDCRMRRLEAEAERDKAMWELGATKDVVILTDEEFAEFEKALLEPPNPTEAAIRGQAMLREWAAKRRTATSGEPQP